MKINLTSGANDPGMICGSDDAAHSLSGNPQSNREKRAEVKVLFIPFLIVGVSENAGIAGS